MTKAERRLNRINVTELQRNLSQTINQVALTEQPMVVEKSGLPVVVLVPFRSYSPLSLEHKRALMEELERQGITSENYMDDPVFQQAKREVFNKRYGNIEPKKKARKPRAKKA